MIKIDIWSDFVCPYCYIAKRELDLAIDELNLADQVNINYMAFELHPEAPKVPGKSYKEAVLNKMPSEEYMVENVLKPMISRAESLGLTMRFDNLDVQNTFDAHRLSKYARFYGKENEFVERCYELIFVENGFLDQPSLIKIGEDLGLSIDQAKAVLEDEAKFRDVVRAEEMKARDLNIQGVPFFIFNDKFALSGAQPRENFIEALKRAKNDGGLIDLSAGSNVCGPDGC